MNQFKRIRNRYKTSEYNYNLRYYARWALFQKSLGLVPLSEYTGTLSALSGELESYTGIRFIGMDLGKGDDATAICKRLNSEITDVTVMLAARQDLEDAFTKAVVTGLGVAVLKQDEGVVWDDALHN